MNTSFERKQTETIFHTIDEMQLTPTEVRLRAREHFIPLRNQYATDMAAGVALYAAYAEHRSGAAAAVDDTAELQIWEHASHHLSLLWQRTETLYNRAIAAEEIREALVGERDHSDHVIRGNAHLEIPDSTR